MAEVSFIVTYRGPERGLLDFITSLRKFYPLSEIVVAEQGNELDFMQGQLFNLAFPHSTRDIVVLMDVDIRFTRPLDFLELMQEIDHPFVGYTRLVHCDTAGRCMRIRPGSDRTTGGCTVFTREQFKDSCGYSNLLRGWGADDSILEIRVGGFRRVDNVMHHIWHPRRKDPRTYERNRVIWEAERTRDRTLDGYRQTTGTLVERRTEGNVIRLVFTEIGVISDFAYAGLLQGAC